MKYHRVMICDQFLDVVSDTEFEAEEKVLDHVLAMSKDELREFLCLISWEDDAKNVDIDLT